MPLSVGSLPADTCGANKSPSFCKLAIIERIADAEVLTPSFFDKVLEPIGSPDSHRLPPDQDCPER